MGRSWSRAVYRPGYAEFCIRAVSLWHGRSWRKHISPALRNWPEQGKTVESSAGFTHCAGSGFWSGAWASACESLSEAVSMARAVGQIDADAETLMALAHSVWSTR